MEISPKCNAVIKLLAKKTLNNSKSYSVPCKQPQWASLHRTSLPPERLSLPVNCGYFFPSGSVFVSPEGSGPCLPGGGAKPATLQTWETWEVLIVWVDAARAHMGSYGWAWGRPGRVSQRLEQVEVHCRAEQGQGRARQGLTSAQVGTLPTTSTVVAT